MENLDDVRQVLLQEPRGYPCQVLRYVFVILLFIPEPEHTGATLQSYC